MQVARVNIAPVPQWSPGAVSPARSTRAAGLLRGGFDALRGEAERAEGVPLTASQVRVLAPFLAKATGVDAAHAYEDLLGVRVLVGGLAAGAGDTATTIGRNIYVSDARHATQLLDWTGRGWLAHELVHTMQWRRDGGSAATEAARDAVFLRRYLGAYVAKDGKVPWGGAWRAAAEAWNRLRRGDSLGNAAELIHDAHPYEAEASRVARSFLTATA